MPKTNTLLDELIRTLNVRKDAFERYSRRLDAVKHYPRRADWYDGNADLYAYAPDKVKAEIRQLRRNAEDAEALMRNLGNRAEDQYREFVMSRPGKRALQEARDEMPYDLMEDYIDMFGSPTNF